MRTASYFHRLTVLTAAIISLPVLAAAQEACTTYTVKDGDTLGSIAQAAYGTFDYQMIFNANRDALAANVKPKFAVDAMIATVGQALQSDRSR